MKCHRYFFCIAGLLVALAYDDISHGKTYSQSHTYTGGNDKYGAHNALDGNPATCTRAKEIGLNSLDESVWWKVDLGRVYNIYNINIMFKKYENTYDGCQKGRFAGFSLFLSKTGDIKGASLCYKDGPQLPPLNFTTVCTESGRYVVFYNERLKGVIYPTGYEVTNVLTELCEVTVQGCNKTSVYGINCDTPCPTNCKDSTCHIQSGACFNCTAGWTAMNCNAKCGEGWYGENCSQQCVGQCRDNTPCNHVTGQCERGCDAGWTGSMCDKGCDSGTFGYNCINNCSGHCLNNSPCNKQTGHCDDGCQPGYVGSDCSKTCTKRYFGTNCSRTCSLNCKHDMCRHTDGSCTTCAAGWMGYNCTRECFQSYGENCLYPCSPHCYNQTCDRLNGRCLMGCQDGYYGEMCEEGRTENNSTEQNVSGFIILAIGLSLSLINLILIGCGIYSFRSRKPNSVGFTGSLLFCWKQSVYENTVVKTEEASTYQELEPTGTVYQNTTIR